MRRLFLAFTLGAALTTPAAADGLVDWNVSRPEIDWGDWTASLGALVGGSVFVAAVPRAGQDTQASLSALLFPHLERTLDNGWEIGLRGAVLAYHDRLSGDIYGDRTFEKAYLFAQTPYGRVELGEDDGAAYRMSMTGPYVDPQVAVDGAGTTFFRDPATGRAFIDIFRLQSAVFAGRNDAKFIYVSPRWFGIQLGASYTPYDAHGGLPFVSRGSRDRQTNLTEAAANYTGYAGTISYGLYAGVALSHDNLSTPHPTPGHDGLCDWGFGGEADDSIAGVKLAFGGAYRRSNAYAFDIGDVRGSGATRSWRVSTTATTGPWIGGLEYAGGDADRASPRPAMNEHGFEASLGYVINADLQLTGGWQQLLFRRDTGGFSTGGTSARLDAEFLHLTFHV